MGYADGGVTVGDLVGLLVVVVGEVDGENEPPILVGEWDGASVVRVGARVGDLEGAPVWKIVGEVGAVG